jgi:hypothetical protein
MAFSVAEAAGAHPRDEGELRVIEAEALSEGGA